ncbi:MAG: arylsulfatase A [Candidatus Binatia bacterium]|jgi:arylsulfatase A
MILRFRSFVGVLACVFLLVSLLSAHGAQKHPNILLMVSDDQGYRDIGAFGSPDIITPNLDRLAAEGVRLTSFYVSWPACTPSRGSLLTGRYPQRNGTYDMYRNEAPDYDYLYKPGEYRYTFERVGGMDTREVLLPKVLKSGGYTSGIYGKWDLGIHKRFLPQARGFDDFYGFVNTGVDYYNHERYGVHSMFRNNTRTEEDKGTYCTYLFEREALRFLDQHHEKPFFLYVPFNAPHSASNLDREIRNGGAQAPDKYRSLYPAPKKPTHSKRTIKGKEWLIPNRDLKKVRYQGSVTAMDDSIGKILERLAKHGHAEDTIVIFFSDNGGSGAADNWPLRGHKSQMWEGGTRVPCIVKWPGKIPAGTVTDEFLTAMEIFPTLCKAAGVALPKNIVYDGFDMLPVLQGKAKSQRTEMFWQRRDDKAARIGNWKWVDASNGRGLFDLSVDIGERNDLSKKKPEVLKRVKARFANWVKTMDEAEPRGPFRDY